MVVVVVVVREIKSEPVYCFEYQTELSSDLRKYLDMPKHAVYAISGEKNEENEKRTRKRIKPTPSYRQSEFTETYNTLICILFYSGQI